MAWRGNWAVILVRKWNVLVLGGGIREEGFEEGRKDR